MQRLDTFRAETRAWLEANCPASDAHAHAGGRDRLGRPPRHLQEPGVEALARAHGGARLDRADLAEGIRRRRALAATRRVILEEEMRRPRLPHAAAELRHLRCSARCCWNTAPRSRSQTHLPKIVARRDPLVPGLQRARRGLRPRQPARPAPCRRASTSWSTATRSGPPTRNFADWIFCLVRTDPTAKKHEGISFLLIDMADPGVRTRPIRLISGASPFCETFFENVRVPPAIWSASSTRAGPSPSACSSTSAR